MRRTILTVFLLIFLLFLSGIAIADTFDSKLSENLAFSLSKFNLYIPLRFEIGSYYTDGTPFSSSIRIRADGFLPVKKGYVLLANVDNLGDYLFTIIKYDSKKEYFSAYGPISIPYVYNIDFNGYIQLIVLHKDDSYVSEDDLMIISENISLMSTTAMNILKYGEQLNAIANNSDAIPEYWIDHINEKLSKIRMLDMQTGYNGDSFFFITDTHYETNALISPSLIKQIKKNSSVYKVFHGGDVYQSSYTKIGALDKIYSWMSLVADIEYYCQIRGNHDTNDAIESLDMNELITDQEYYGIYLKSKEHIIKNDDRMPYYYCDNKVQKIRYIILDTGSKNTMTVSQYEKVQMPWLKDRINELEADWSIIVFQHIVFDDKPAIDTTALSYHEYGNTLVKLLDSLYDRENKAQIIGVITGHVHRDYSTYSDKGYPIIATTCDTGAEIATYYDPVNTDRSQGTTNEQAFDVYHIDKANQKIYLTRIGAGEDREFSFNCFDEKDVISQKH